MRDEVYLTTIKEMKAERDHLARELDSARAAVRSALSLLDEGHKEEQLVSMVRLVLQDAVREESWR